MLKNGFLTFCCAFIPGAGQMYQGYMKRGLSLILTACLHRDGELTAQPGAAPAGGGVDVQLL